MAIPAQLDPEVVKIMRTNAEKAFRAIGGLGLARCDFFYTDKGDLLKRTQYHARIYPMVYVSLCFGDNMALNPTDLITC